MRALTWIPGGMHMLKELGEIDLRKDAPLGKIVRLMPGLRNVPDHKISHFPHSLHQAISYSVGAVGPEGPAYDEFMLEFLIRETQRAGHHTEHPEFIHDLRREFHTGPLPRLEGTLRKYWWIVPAATAGVALVTSVEEETKQHK